MAGTSKGLRGRGGGRQSAKRSELGYKLQELFTHKPEKETINASVKIKQNMREVLHSNLQATGAIIVCVC
jgi:hypothetical protein